MKRICVLNNYTISSNQGGPVGVIRESFGKLRSDFWELRDISDNSFWKYKAYRLWTFASNIIRKPYGNNCNIAADVARIKAAYSAMAGMREYNYIWFHDLVPFCALQPMLKRNQKTILQLHYPELPSAEVAKNQWYGTGDLTLFKLMEKRALETADVIVLANKGAEGIYGQLLPVGRRIVYLPNAMDYPKVGEIPLLSRDHTNFIFIGRRNLVKGFDLMLEAFSRALTQNPLMRLYLCGNGEPVVQPGVVDLGFSRVPEKWLAAADAVIIPNRSSYLDLNLIQALSLNKPVIMSCTEGHEIFHKASSAIYEIKSNSIGDLTSALLASPRWLASLGGSNTENFDLYERNFALPNFSRTLDRICQDLLSQ
jgi:glycosyltransferase involved in cell wall biosynthesis